MVGSIINAIGSPGAAFIIANDKIVIPNNIGIDMSVLRMIYVIIFIPFLKVIKKEGKEAASYTSLKGFSLFLIQPPVFGFIEIFFRMEYVAFHILGIALW